MPHIKIIGLTGLAGSGKDTVADLLTVHSGFVKVAFADALRLEAADAFNIDVRHFTFRDTKELPLRCLALARCLSAPFVERMQMHHALAGQVLDLEAPRSPRQIMQWWGTEYRRAQHTAYWLQRMMATLNTLLRERTAAGIVVTDCRFSNEVDLVRLSYGGEIWQVLRPGIEPLPGAHASETGGAYFHPNRIITNGHTVGHLQQLVLGALAEPEPPRIAPPQPPEAERFALLA